MKFSSRFSNTAAAVILLLGLTRMAGHWWDCRWLQGLGAASGIAPFTKVFSSVDGYEAFTAQCGLRATDAAGIRQEIRLTPARYAGIRGPYLRRNVHGAMLVFAPRLPENLRASLHRQALRPHAGLRRELGIPEDWTDFEIFIEPRAGSTETSFTYPITLP